MKSKNTYNKRIKKIYKHNRLEKYDEDIIQQIEEISMIALIKIWFFDISLTIFLLGILGGTILTFIAKIPYLNFM